MGWSHPDENSPGGEVRRTGPISVGISISSWSGWEGARPDESSRPDENSPGGEVVRTASRWRPDVMASGRDDLGTRLASGRDGVRTGPQSSLYRFLWEPSYVDGDIHSIWRWYHPDAPPEENVVRTDSKLFCKGSSNRAKAQSHNSGCRELLTARRHIISLLTTSDHSIDFFLHTY